MSFIKKHIISILFVIVAYITLLCHSDYLFAISDNSLFVAGNTFMREVISERGGLWAWIGCWLTQFFYYPWMGTTILILLWLITYYCLISLFSLKGWTRLFALLPQCALLYLLLCLGYWIYYIKSAGIAFVPTLVLVYTSVLALVADYLIRRFLHHARWWQPYLLFLLAFITTRPVLKIYSVTMPEKSFRSELRMYRAIEEGRWNDVISEHHTIARPTNLMVVYKNIALMHSNNLQDMFKTNNCGSVPPPLTRLMPADTLQIRISRLAAPMVYFQYGQLNYAYERAMSNIVKYGLTARDIKVMVRCAIMNQEFDLARKYLSLLKATIFHRHWANEQERLIHSSTLLMQSAEFQNIAPLLTDEPDNLDSDNGMCEQWILNHFADLLHPSNPKLEEVVITTSLWAKDEYAFDIHFYNYVNAHPDDAIPYLYQEAAILLCTREDSPITLDHFPFDNIIADRYNRFVNDYNQLSAQRLSDTEMSKRLQAVYGDTYWWYYYFYTDFNLY